MITEADLNGREPLPYKPFEGRYIDEMPRLRADNRRPLTAKDIAEKRIEVLKSKNAKLIDAWVNNYYDTASGIVYFGNEIKVIPYCEVLSNIDSDAELENGALTLTPEQYKSLEGKVLNRAGLKLNKLLTKQEAKEHPVWKALLGDALNPYADAMFKFGKKRYDVDNLMSICMSNAKNTPTLRAWCFFIFPEYGRSGIFNGGNYLGAIARLVGVPE